MERLKDKVAVITGGNSGIGLATAQRFVKEGAKVVITARREEAVHEYNSSVNGSSVALHADVTDHDSTRDAIEEAVEKYGKIDVLFLNAGVGKPRPIEHTDVETYKHQWDINFGGAYFAVKSALPHLSEGASIIFNTSIANVKGMPGMSVYSATKAGLRSLVRTLAAELSERHIRVNAIAPGPIETPIWNKMEMPEDAASEFAENVIAQVPLGRLGKSEEIANAALFLASDEASYVNGIELPVDGGLAQV